MAEYVMEYDGWAEGIPVGEYLKVRDAMHARKREEIVRCRDCKHHTDHSINLRPHWCRKHGSYRISPDFFCAGGERKDGQKNS